MSLARARGTTPDTTSSPFLGRSSTPASNSPERKVGEEDGLGQDKSNGQMIIASPDAAKESQWAREQQEYLAFLEERRRLQEQVDRWSREGGGGGGGGGLGGGGGGGKQSHPSRMI
jgi:hypothetical protein